MSNETPGNGFEQQPEDMKEAATVVAQLVQNMTSNFTPEKNVEGDAITVTAPLVEPDVNLVSFIVNRASTDAVDVIYDFGNQKFIISRAKD